MIDQQTIERILEATRIEEVVGDFVSLKRRGANLIACCPFHNEKTPSFSVSPTKGIFKCFGCGKAGSAVSFLMEHEHISYVEALRYLGRKYGIEIRESNENPEDVQRRLLTESLLIVNNFAKDFFASKLHDPKDGYIGMSYFQERGFTEHTMRKFGLGYSPDAARAFTTQAQLKGYKTEHLIKTGLVCQSEERSDLFDRFRGRAMFPWHSISGKVIAFGGRILTSDKTKAKYVNSPESEIFVKNKSLYGIFEAKSAIAKKDNCYLVEGYTDVIQFHQSGVENVVASGGTSLTSGQIALIKRFTNNITVLYDGDWAGIKASIRGIDMFLKEGMNVKAALFPDGEDPDSYARKHSQTELEQFLESSAEDFIDFKYRILAADENLERDPIRRSRVIAELVNSIALIPDPILRTLYTDSTAKKLSLDAGLLSSEIGKAHQRVVENKIKEDAREHSEALRRERLAAMDARQSNDGDDFPAEGGYDTGNAAAAVPVYGYGRNADAGRFVKEPWAFCKESEEEIIYYLLKFGKSEFYPGEAVYGQEVPEAEIVEQYIKSYLECDNIQMQCPMLRTVYEEYFSMNGQSQNRIINHFLNHPQAEIAAFTANLLVQPYEITIKEFNKSIVPENVMLGKVIPKCICIYKAKLVSQKCQEVQKEIEKVQNSGDSKLLLKLMKTLARFNNVKKQLLEASGRYSI